MAVNFEENMDKLQDIVDNLESGELDLQASIKAYEDGKALLKKLEAQLSKAEARVKMLGGEEADDE